MNPNGLKGKALMDWIRSHRKPPLPVADRFWPKVDKSAGPDACWPWTGCIQTRGYGQFYVGMEGERMVRQPAHRVAWELTHGPIPAGLVIDHKCKNTVCVNPAHLRPVSQEDNCTVLARPTPFWTNKQKTHCSKGHPFEGENVARVLVKNSSGTKWRPTRICLTCTPSAWNHPRRFWYPGEIAA
jgi:hypothetical protein